MAEFWIKQKMLDFFPEWKCTSYRTLLFTRSCGFHCQGWSDWQSPDCCQQMCDLNGQWAVLGTILLDWVAFPSSCIQCLSCKCLTLCSPSLTCHVFHAKEQGPWWWVPTGDPQRHQVFPHSSEAAVAPGCNQWCVWKAQKRGFALEFCFFE